MEYLLFEPLVRRVGPKVLVVSKVPYNTSRQNNPLSQSITYEN